jgi:photosystem II stability/assembly factor-like uncharacterized protein
MLATSGGQTLGPERPVAARGFNAQGASYLTAQTGWIVGSVLSVEDPDPGMILATTNGGQSWQTQFPTR